MRRVAGVALVLGAIVAPSLSADAQQPQPATVNDNYFAPVPITVDLGDSVTWIDQGNNPHSVTADGVFDSTDPNKQCTAIVGGDGCLSKGDEFTVTFNTAGTFSYHCRVHGAAMVGSVIVRSPTTTSSSTTTSTTSATTSTTTAETSTSPASDLPTASQAPLPSISSTSRVALPKSIIRAKNGDDTRPWALIAVGIAGATTIAGIVLVRRGRVPLG